MAGALYVVATPLGNLDDLSPRAQQILRDVNLVACEDTRHTRKLLNHFGIHTRTTSYHEHNEAFKTGVLMGRLREGQQIALVADAGTPLVSDPGFPLVRACREERISIYPVPGPSAAMAALSVSGLPTDRCLFVGFLSRRISPQREQLRTLSHQHSTMLLYISPHGLIQTLRRIVEHFGDRRAFLAREMTKLHETHYFGRLGEIIQVIQQESPRGEYTLVVEGAPLGAQAASFAIDVEAYIHGLMEMRGVSHKEAVKMAAKELGLPKREIYQETVGKKSRK